MLRKERVRRAIRPMVLPGEVLERRALFTVNPNAFLPSIVSQYWNYTDTMYGPFSDMNTTTSASTSTVTLSDGTYYNSYNDVGSYTPGGSNGSPPATWTENDTDTQIWSTTDYSTNAAGYSITLVSYLYEWSNVTASGSIGATNYTQFTYNDVSNSSYIETATKGNEVVTARIDNYVNWIRNGSGNAAGAAPVTSASLSAWTAAGSGSISGSGGTNTYSDVISSSSTSLNEQSPEQYWLTATANQTGGSGSGGTIVSSFSMSANGSEDYSLVSTQSAARVTGGPGTDYSYIDDVATDTYNVGDGGGSGTGGAYGSFSLSSSGSNWSVREIWGSGASGGASDSYNITDDSYSVFNESDIGSPGPSKNDELTDNTIESDLVIASASGTSVRPGSLDGTGTDSYSFSGSTVLHYGQFASGSSPAVYDTLTSGFNATGTFSSATLDNTGTDTETIILWGSGNGTVEEILPGSGSSNHVPVSDSYYETETRARSYALVDNAYGSMSMYDDTSDSASGTAGFAGYSFSMAEYDMNNISETLSSSGVYAFNMSASGYGPGGSYTQSETGNNSGTTSYSLAATSAGGGVPTFGSVGYNYIGNPGDFNAYTSATIQRPGGQYTINPMAVTYLIDGSDETWDTNGGGGFQESVTEAYGVSDPIATTNNLNGSSYREKSGFIQLEVPLTTIQDLAFTDAQYGRTTSLYIMQHDMIGPPPNPYSPYTDESELVSPTNADNLASQGLTFLETVKTDLAEGGVETWGGNNTTTSEGQFTPFLSQEITQSNGVYASKTHIYFDPGFFTTGFYLLKNYNVSGDPFDE